MRGWIATGFILAALLSAGTASAQTATRMEGVVVSLAVDTLIVKTPSGSEVPVALPADTRITALANRQLSDIRPGDFVGSAAMKGMDGKLHAQEVHIFPEALRGSGEGHRDMAKPDQSMTNATVAEVTKQPQGQVLTMKYQGGIQEIVVGPEARIVTFVMGDRSLLRPGAVVVISGSKDAAGLVTARSIQAEKDGVMPLIF